MATATPKTATTQQIGNCTLTLTANTAQLTNTQTGVRIWNLSASLFPPSQVGTPPVVSATVFTRTHTIHPPPPPNGGGNKNEVGVEIVPLAPPLEPDTTVTVTTITITLTGARFSGTNIPADCSLVITQSTNSDDPGSGFPTIKYSQTFGGLSFYGEDDDYSGYETVTAPIPAGSLSLPQGGTLALSAGLSASIAICPGYMNIYNGANAAAVATGSAPLLGAIAPTNLTLSATQGIGDGLGITPPTPPYQSDITVVQSGGWLVPLPGSAVEIGTLSAAAGNNFDTALIAVGEDTAGNISYFAELSSAFVPGAPFQAQYDFTLASGLALAGDPTAAPVVLSLIGCQLFLDFRTATPAASLAGSFGFLNPAPLTTGSIALWPVTGGTAGGFAFDFSFTPARVQDTFLVIAQALCSLPDALTRPLPWTFGQSGNTGLALVAAPPAPTPEHANYLVLGEVAAGAPQALLTSLSMEVTRPVDMAVASFSFQNCGVQQVGGGGLSFVQWAASPQNQPSSMTVTLPPQHISECAYPLDANNNPLETLGPVPVPTRMAGATTLQLKLPYAEAAPWTAETLFDWTQYSLLSPQPGTIAQPDPTSVTVIEVPYRLDLALDQDAGWVQPSTPAPDAANSPLWHARLGVQLERSDGTGLFVNERSILVKHARATWTYDTPGAASAFAYEALNPAAREDIVYETEQINVPSTDITLDHLILSPLGAWAHLRSSWPGGTPPAGHSLAAWTQIISQGRDQYVRAVTVGYLLPWGHVASVVEVAERRFSGDAENTAYLCAKSYIVVGEVTRTYTNPDGSQVQLDAVLTQVDPLTQITPTIDQTTGAITVNDGTGPAFIPYVGGQPFLFHARVYDNDHLAQPPRKTADTYLGAIFVNASASQALITAALNAYNTGSTTAAVAHAAPHTDPLPSGNGLVPSQLNTLASVALNGQKMALATSNVLGDTTHAITSLSMQVSALVPQGATGVPWNLAAPNFYPALNQAQISLPAVSMLTSGADEVAGDVAVSYLPQYLTGASNPVDAYMSMATPITAALAGAKANGLIAPALAFSGLSRTFGALIGDVGTLAPVTDPLANLLAGNLDPSKFFPSGAKLLNLISFTDLVGAVEGLTSFDSSHIPQVKVDTSDPTKIVATMNWLPTLSWPPATPNGMTLSGATPSAQQNTWNVPGGFASLTFNGDLAGSLTLNSTITTAPAGPVPVPIPTVSTMVATVSNFTLSVLGLVKINFASLTFTSTTGKKPAVQVSLVQSPLKPFVLTGDIDFLQVLFEAIEDLFGGGTVNPGGR